MQVWSMLRTTPRFNLCHTDAASTSLHDRSKIAISPINFALGTGSSTIWLRHIPVVLSAVVALSWTAPAHSIISESLTSNPEELSASDAKVGPQLSKLMKGPHKDAISSCTRKCLPACMRGGQGGPGLGPLTLRRDPIQFKEGFRSRSYCLSECTQVCAASVTGVPAAVP